MQNAKCKRICSLLYLYMLNARSTQTDFRKKFQMDFQYFWLGPKVPTVAAEGCTSPQELEKANCGAAFFLVLIKVVKLRRSKCRWKTMMICKILQDLWWIKLRRILIRIICPSKHLISFYLSQLYHAIMNNSQKI